MANSEGGTFKIMFGSCTKAWRNDGRDPIRVTAITEYALVQANAIAVAFAAAAPGLSISGPSSLATGSPYTLALSADEPADAAVTGWSIDWGDNTSDTAPGDAASATHTYAAIGQYTITATATDQNGDHAASSKSITVRTVAAPTGLTAAVNADNNVVLTWTNADPAADTTEIQWSDNNTDFNTFDTVPAAETTPAFR